MHPVGGAGAPPRSGGVFVAGENHANSGGDNNGCLLLLLCGAVIFVIGKCTSGTGSDSASKYNLAGDAAPVDANAVADAPPAPPPLQPLDALSAKAGFRHFRLSDGAEGSAGALIYSRNCYEALKRSFSWSRLDTCGAFDVAASSTVGEDAAATVEQSEYFEREAAAGRYLAAATGAGEPADDADRRLLALQRLLPPTPAPVEAAAEDMVSEGEADAGDPDADLDALGANTVDE